MAGYLNKVQLIGNLGQDPDVRTTQSGSKVVNLSIATSESWTDKRNGEKRERVEWHRVVIFSDGLAGVVEKYMQKGSRVYVEGALHTRKWKDQDGHDRYTTEIVLKPFSGQLIMLDGANRHSGEDGSTDTDDTAENSAHGPGSGSPFDNEVAY